MDKQDNMEYKKGSFMRVHSQDPDVEMNADGYVTRFNVHAVKEGNATEDYIKSNSSMQSSNISRQNSRTKSNRRESDVTQISVAANDMGTWLVEPGAVMGSSILLASRSYLDIYQESEDSGISAIKEDAFPENTEIFDNPEYIDTLQGRLPLAEAARMISKEPSKHKLFFDENHIRKAKIDCYKRIVIVGISILLVYSSYYGIRNASSSLEADKRLALMAYGSLFYLMWFGGVIANPLARRIRPKWAMSLASLGFIIYPLSQFYPAYYTLIPVSVITGFCSGVLWSVEGIYLMNTASTYAFISGEKLVDVVTRLNGIIFSLFLGSNILGNLLGSLALGDFYKLPGEVQTLSALSAYNSSSVLTMNTTISAEEITSDCGIDFFTNPSSSKRTVYAPKRYVFYGICTGLSAIGCLTFIVFVKKLKVAKPAGNDGVVKALKDFGKMLSQPRSIILIPFMAYFGIVGTVILADYNAAYIACQYGADKVGYAVVAAYAFSVTGSFVSSRLIAKVGRPPFLLISFLISMSSMIFILIWKPTSGSIGPMAFLPVCLWGLADGVLYTQCNSFVSMLFNKQVALALTMVSSYMAMTALFGTITMAYGVITLTVKIYIVIGLNIVAAICYIALEILLKKDKI